MLKKIVIITATLTVLVALGYFLTLGIGKPIRTDLSVIGQGKPVLALAYENYSPTGGEALNRLRQIRSDYDSRLDFVVADMGTPEGRKLTSRYKLLDGQALFLTQEGKPVRIVNIPADQQKLRRLLETNLVIIEGKSEAASQ